MCMSICSDIRVIRCTSTLLQNGQEPNSSKGLTLLPSLSLFFSWFRIITLIIAETREILKISTSNLKKRQNTMPYCPQITLGLENDTIS